MDVREDIEIEHASALDFIQLKDGAEYTEETQSVVADFNKYLEPFAKPLYIDDDQHCLNCKKPINGFMEAVGLAVAYRWSIAHGEANCSGCGWPARGMHYIKDEEGNLLFDIKNLFIPYHPDFVSSEE